MRSLELFVGRSLVLGSILIACSRAPREQASSDPPSGGTTAAATSSQPPVPFVSTPLADVEPWNPKEIDWQPFDGGLAIAKKQNKPVCLVLYTTWCPHCRNYSRVFGDPRLVERAKDFVMIRLDADANEAIAKRYQPDGGYVPRTFILDSEGHIEPQGTSGHPRYAHFFDEFHADSLLRAMAASPTSRAKAGSPHPR